MVIDESPSSLSSLAVMQMDDDLPVHVHLNVYWYVKAMVTCEKVQKYPVGFTIESLPLYVMVMHKFSY